MLTDEPNFRKALRRMVVALEENLHAREVLLQDAEVYLLSRERQHPGQQRSWYLQGVNFYLHHLRASGRSLDSPKHREAQAVYAETSEGWDQRRDSLDLDEGFMSAVNANDIFSVLVARLIPIDQTILVALTEGLEDRDIAEKLHVSRMFVLRHRRGIAKLAIKLGINPVAPFPLRRTSSKKSKTVEA